MAPKRLLQVGEKAPAFTLPKASGGVVSLTDFRGRADVVLFFYARDNTPVCTVEACSFRDSYEAFRDAGAEVIGISSDPVESHERFATRFGLPFVLLSDEGGVVRERFGVGKTLGLFPGRTTFLIDRDGVIRHVFSSQFLPAKHVREALAVLNSFRGGH